jgi:hypothetical protein
MRAKIVNRNGYRCAPDGHTVQFFALGEIVTGEVAAWSVDERSAIPVVEISPAPALEAKVIVPQETKRTPPITEGRVKKGGQNRWPSQVAIRPPAPTPTRPKKDAR